MTLMRLPPVCSYSLELTLSEAPSSLRALIATVIASPPDASIATYVRSGVVGTIGIRGTSTLCATLISRVTHGSHRDVFPVAFAGGYVTLFGIGDGSVSAIWVLVVALTATRNRKHRGDQKPRRTYSTKEHVTSDRTIIIHSVNLWTRNGQRSLRLSAKTVAGLNRPAEEPRCKHAKLEDRMATPRTLLAVIALVVSAAGCCRTPSTAG